jgi:DNA replication protein DnaC
MKNNQEIIESSFLLKLPFFEKREHVRAFMGEFKSNLEPASQIVQGSYGTGKTFSSIALLREIYIADYHTQATIISEDLSNFSKPEKNMKDYGIIYWGYLLDLLNITIFGDSYEANRAKSELNYYKTCNFLIIDDFADSMVSDKISSKYQSYLQEFFDYRYQFARSDLTVFTTNINIIGIDTRNVKSVLNGATIDRIIGIAGKNPVVVMNGVSKR